MSSMNSMVCATSTRDYLTPFAQAMPDEYKNRCAVTAYRNYYQSKIHSAGGVRYVRKKRPSWFKDVGGYFEGCRE